MVRIFNRAPAVEMSSLANSLAGLEIVHNRIVADQVRNAQEENERIALANSDDNVVAVDFTTGKKLEKPKIKEDSRTISAETISMFALRAHTTNASQVQNSAS